MVKTIEWKENKIVMIDQRKLPAKKPDKNGLILSLFKMLFWKLLCRLTTIHRISILKKLWKAKILGLKSKILE